MDEEETTEVMQVREEGEEDKQGQLQASHSGLLHIHHLASVRCFILYFLFKNCY